MHRDPQTGEQIIAGLSQVHVEVVVDRLRARFGAEVTLTPPRVPFQETVRAAARAHGRHKKQSGGRGQFGDCHIEIEPLEPGTGFEFVDRIKGGAIPSSFIPAVEKGVIEAMARGVLGGYPVCDVRVTLVDGSFHSVDSNELAFKLAGSLAMRQALEQAQPVLLEPIMRVTLSVPEHSVGEVIGDLNSRRGHPLGMEPAGTMTQISAEVPMCELLTYAPDLRSITAGQGDYTMESQPPRGGAGTPAREAAAWGCAGARPRVSRAVGAAEARRGPLPCPVATRQLQTVYEPVKLRGVRPFAVARRASDEVLGGLRGARRLRAVHDACGERGVGARGSAAPRVRRPRPWRGAGALARQPASRARREEVAPAPGAAPAHHVHAVPSAEHAQLARAVQLFNASESTRTIAGVTRSLGSPAVSVRITEGDVLVLIVVVWELCWYRYEVDLESDSVRLHSQGYEPDEIEPEFGAGDDSADERGMLALLASR